MQEHLLSPPLEALSISIHHSALSRSKRLLDVVGSLVGLLILAALLPAIALIIRLDSSGPVFYKQSRVGLGGKPFRLWKFRSMVSNAEQLKALVTNQAMSQLFFKCQDDPRVTRVGRVLRATSIDEMPQFWNVLKGDMSLVGTRPPTLDEVEHYQPQHWQRLSVKPGLTGVWQVSGRSAILDFEQVFRLDMTYQQNWELWDDVKILAHTLWVLWRRGSAY
jgi:lipopolysaccharide/colanic/teichoic acid biosynthesis glycosyltransferase